MGVDFEDVTFLVEVDTALHSRTKVNTLSVRSIVHHISDDDGWVVDKSCGHLHILDNVLEFLAHVIYKWLEGLCEGLNFSAGIIGFSWVFEIVAGNIDDPVLLVLLEVGEHILVEWIVTKNNLVTASDQLLDEW